ncbi:MAG: thioredoxin fold domain-containing protein [Pseudomonadota bacterium]
MNRFPKHSLFGALARLTSGLLAGLLLACGAGAQGVERATDLHALTSEGDGKATVIMFASSSCPYCDRAEQHYLGPMSQDPAFAGVNIRKVMLDREPVRDFDGERMLGSELGGAYGVRVVPTIMAFDADGQPVGRPLVGIPNEDLYRSQIRVRINAARRSTSDTSD